MSVAEMFSEFIGNLRITNIAIISMRYGELTAALNKEFRDTDSKTDNSLQVGSFGRKTGINGISDLDMLYIMPQSKWVDYNTAGGQQKLLEDTKDAIRKRYSMTKLRVDRLVVTVTYNTNFRIEVQPVFEQDDGSFLYPDTKDDGSWKTTKPREEMEAIADMNQKKNRNLRRLCKMARAWKNKHGVNMGGLLIDTLAYNFLESTSDFDTTSFSHYDEMSRDFFKYLSEQPDQSYYYAPGSRQQVKVKARFQSKAKKAYKFCKEAIEAEGQKNAYSKWKKVYGRPFPSPPAEKQSSLTGNLRQSWRDTEQYIEDKFPVDIRDSMRLDCVVSQPGFRPASLRDMIRRMMPLRTKKSLVFEVTDISTPKPYDIYWKVLNRGDEARRRDCIRGQIVRDKGKLQKDETTNFRGDHIVECYCVKDGVVVAKNRIHVNIVPEQGEDD